MELLLDPAIEDSGMDWTGAMNGCVCEVNSSSRVCNCVYIWDCGCDVRIMGLSLSATIAIL